MTLCKAMERVTGIEPVWVAWKATAQPLGHTRPKNGRTARKHAVTHKRSRFLAWKAMTLPLSYSRATNSLYSKLCWFGWSTKDPSAALAARRNCIVSLTVVALFQVRTQCQPASKWERVPDVRDSMTSGLFAISGRDGSGSTILSLDGLPLVRVTLADFVLTLPSRPHTMASHRSPGAFDLDHICRRPASRRPCAFGWESLAPA